MFELVKTKYKFTLKVLYAIHQNIINRFYLVSKIHIQLTEILKALFRTLSILQVPNLS